jgi:hypothetical protein
MDLISHYRRSPTRCLYCERVPNGDEHVIQQSVGGRLTASILCAHHNNASKADDYLATWFAPLVHLLYIPRHDGSRGTEYVAKAADGTLQRVTADGNIIEKKPRLDKNDQGKIIRAVGDLAHIEHIRKQHMNAFATEMPVIAVPGIPPAVQVNLGLNDSAHAGVIKMAYHFVAGFLADVVIPEDVRNAIETGDPPPPGKYLRMVPYATSGFGEAEPLRHEVTAYPAGDDTLVTLYLFSLLPVVVKLPGVSVPRALRYIQKLDAPAPPELCEVDSIHVPFGTNMTTAADGAFRKEMKGRLEAAYRRFKIEEHQDMIVIAMRLAIADTRLYGTDFWELFDAQLQLCQWPEDHRRAVIAQTRKLVDQGLSRPWEIPLFREGRPKPPIDSRKQSLQARSAS